MRVLRCFAGLYTRKRIPQAAAALSYYLTMSSFPLIICLYSLLGNNYAKALRILEFLDEFFSAETTRMLKSFFSYVAMSHSTPMLIAGITVLLTTASAASRSLQSTIGKLQGGRRYRGFRYFLFSLVFSLAFLAAMYFAIVVMFTGQKFIELINGYLPFVDISSSWQYVRFLLLGGIMFVIFWGVYELSKRRTDRYSTVVGALFATIGMVIMCLILSGFIAVSTRYPLVYGSLASLILLMFWLFLSCQIIYMGAALNVAIRDAARLEEEKKETE